MFLNFEAGAFDFEAYAYHMTITYKLNFRKASRGGILVLNG